MPDLDALPPDQRALLQLLLEQQRSYDEIATLLDIDVGAVRDRAHAALDSLGGVEPRQATGPAARPARPRMPASIPRPTSRRGGALLLGGIGAVVAVVVVLLVTGGGDDGKKTTTAASGTTGAQSRPIAQINLLPARRGSRAVGLAQVFARSGQRALIVAGQGVSAGAYALWLYNRPGSAEFLGFVPQRVGSAGTFVTQGVLPRDASTFREIVVTRELITSTTRSLPKRPGTIVLRGRLALS